MDTDWGLVADDRINTQLDFKRINNRQDYINEMRSLLNKSSTGRTILKQNVLNEMYENSEARIIVERKKIESSREAQQFHKRRSFKTRTRDERKTAKNTMFANKKSVRRWKRNPTRSDIMGVDTKLDRTLRRRRNLITKADLKLTNKGIKVSLNSKGIKQYRDLNTGRFVKKPR